MKSRTYLLFALLALTIALVAACGDESDDCDCDDDAWLQPFPPVSWEDYCAFLEQCDLPDMFGGDTFCEPGHEADPGECRSFCYGLAMLATEGESNARCRVFNGCPI